MKIIKQIDADTFLVEINGEVRSVRINNVDAHESTPFVNPTELGNIAKQYVANEDPTITLLGGSGGYGRTLGSMHNPDGEDIGVKLASQGLGVALTPEASEQARLWRKGGARPEADPAQQALIDRANQLRANGVKYQNARMPDFSFDDPRSTTERAWERGKLNLKANAYAFLQALQGMEGDTKDSEESLRRASYYAQQAGLIKKDFNSFKDVDSIRDAANYAYELLIEESPSLALDGAASLIGVGFGTAVARRAAMTAIRNKLGEDVAQNLALKHPQLLADLKAIGARAGAKRGAAAGYVASTYPQEVGAVQQELNENDVDDAGSTALAMGAVSSVAQVLPEFALAGRLLKSADVDASDLSGIFNTAKEITKNTALTAAGEGTAEAMATTIQKSAVALHDDNYDVFSKQNVDEIIESAVAGATLGGVFGGTSTAGAAVYRKADQIYREKRQAAVDAQNQMQQDEANTQQTFGASGSGVTVDSTKSTEVKDPDITQLLSDVQNNREVEAQQQVQQQQELASVSQPVTTAVDESAQGQQILGQDSQPNTGFESETAQEDQELERMLADITIPTQAQANQESEQMSADITIPTQPLENQAPEQMAADVPTPTQTQENQPLEQMSADITIPTQAQEQTAPTTQATETTDTQKAPQPTEEEVARMREHPMFKTLQAHLESVPEGQSALKDGLILADDLSPDARTALADALIEVDTDNGPKLAVHPQLVQDVFDYATPAEPEVTNYPKGSVYDGPAPELPKDRGESIGFKAMYGEGNPVADGSYDRGTGRSVFNELAAIAADPSKMRDGAATKKFVDMASNIDPLSDEFDAQLEKLAQYVRLKGINQNDNVLAMLDRARLKEPVKEKTVPTLLESYKSWLSQQADSKTGEGRRKHEAANGFIRQLSEHLKSTGAIDEVAPSTQKQFEDIIRAFGSGRVEVTPKLQSIVHAIASNTYTRTSGLWKDKTGTTHKIYTEQSQKVTDHQNTPTTEKLPPEVVTKLAKIASKVTKSAARISGKDSWFFRKHATERIRENNEKIKQLQERKVVVEMTTALRDPSHLKQLNSELSQQNQVAKELDSRIDDVFRRMAAAPDNEKAPLRAEYQSLLDERSKVGNTLGWLYSRIDQLSNDDVPEVELDNIHPQISKLRRENSKLVDLLSRLSAMSTRNPKKAKALAKLHKRFNEMGEDAAPLKEVIASFKGIDTTVEAVEFFEDEDGKNADKENVSMSEVSADDDDDTNAKDLTDIAKTSDLENAVIRLSDIQLSESAEKFVNDFIRTELDTNSEMVERMPQQSRLEFFARRYTQAISDAVDGSTFDTPEAKNERRVRLGSKLSIARAVTDELVGAFKVDIDLRNPSKEARNSVEYQEELSALRKQVFNEVLPHVAGKDTDELRQLGVEDYTSSKRVLDTLRDEIQGRRKSVEAPSDAQFFNGKGENYGSKTYEWVNNELPPETERSDDPTIEEVIEYTRQDVLRARNEKADDHAPHGGKTARDMFDLSYGMFRTIRQGVRMMFDARWHSQSLSDARAAYEKDGIAGIVKFAVDNDVIPTDGNEIGKLFNSTIDFAAANRTSVLSRYIIDNDSRDAKGKGVVAVEFVDAKGSTARAKIDVLGFIRDQVEAASPDMVDADHGARKGSDSEVDGVRDTSDPLSNRADFDRIPLIKEAFYDLIARMSVPDDRIFGFRVTPETIQKLLNDPDLLLLDDGADSVTLGHLRNTLATRAMQAKLAENYWATHDTTELKRQKAQAAMTLESMMKILFNIIAPRDGSTAKKETLAALVAKADGRMLTEERLTRELKNLPRQLAALRDLVYGENMRHLDTTNEYERSKRAFEIAFQTTGDKAEDHAKTQALRATDLAEHLFITPDMPDVDLERLDKVAQDARNSASLSKASNKRDFTKTTELADMKYLSKVFDAIAANPAQFDLEQEDVVGLTKQLREAHEDLISAREALALAYPASDKASKADDRAAMADENEVDTRELAEEDKSRRSTLSEDEQQRKATERFDQIKSTQDTKRLNDLYGGLSDDDITPVFIRANTSDTPAMTMPKWLDEKARGVISNVAIQMSEIVFGKGAFHNYIDFVDGDRSSIDYKEGRLIITLPLRSTDFNNGSQLVQLVREMSHEFAHAVASIHSLRATDAKLAMDQYLKDVPEAVRGSYDVDEWLADLIATRIIRKMSNLIANEAASTGPFSRLVNSIVFRINQIFSKMAAFQGKYGLNRQSMPNDQTEIMFWADRLIERSRRASANSKFNVVANSGIKFYTTRDAITGMAKAKGKALELAKDGLDSAVVKLFKPVNMRLQKIDRTLARMFFNPPGANQEQGMGLMDMTVSTRTQLVNYFNRGYRKVDDFRIEYNKYLETGEATPRLSGIFRRAAEAYSKVNPNFSYSGIPVMLSMDEITRRGGEFVQLLDHEKAEDLLKSFDRSGGDATNNIDIKPANPFGRQELLDELIRNRPEVRERLQQAGFFEPPTVAGLNKFFGGVAMRTEFERVFGGQRKVSESVSDYSPNGKLVARLEAIKDPVKRREAIAMIGSMLGFDGARIHPAWRKTQDWTIATVSAMILPLSGFASLPDPMMPFIRTRSWKEAVIGLFNVVKMYATDYGRVREITRALSLATNTIHDTVWSTVVINRDGNSFPERMSEFLFRYNGLQFLTNLSRNVSAVLALDMLRRHSSGMTEYSRQFLREMGITSDEAARVIAYMDEHGTVPQYRPGDDVANELHDIAQRVVTTFTNSSLIHPNKAQLPAIANDPNFRVLTLLKPFLYGFHSTIYGGNYRAGRTAMAKPRTLGDFLLSSPIGMMPMALAFGLMMPLAAAGLLARETFQDFVFGTNKVERLEAMDDMEYLNKIFARAGGYGMLEYPMQIWEATQADYRNPIITALGPVVGNLNTVASDVYGVYVKGNRDSIRLGLFELPVD